MFKFCLVSVASNGLVVALEEWGFELLSPVDFHGVVDSQRDWERVCGIYYKHLCFYEICEPSPKGAKWTHVDSAGGWRSSLKVWLRSARLDGTAEKQSGLPRNMFKAVMRSACWLEGRASLVLAEARKTVRHLIRGIRNMRQHVVFFSNHDVRR